MHGILYISRKQPYYREYTIIILIIQQQTLAKWTPQGHGIEANYTAMCRKITVWSLQWRHKERYGVSNHRRLDCLQNRLFRRRSKKTSKLRVTPAQGTSNSKNVSIWWRLHVQMSQHPNDELRWGHDIETLSALLALCEGNYWSPAVNPHKGPVMWALTISLMLDLITAE